MAELTTIPSATDANFDAEVIDSDLPVLVDFWADWCHPCHLIEPHVKALASEQAGKLRVIKLDIDENPETARRFGVMSIPTLLLFKEGVEKARLIGSRPKDAIWGEISAYV